MCRELEKCKRRPSHAPGGTPCWAACGWRCWSATCCATRCWSIHSWAPNGIPPTTCASSGWFSARCASCRWRCSTIDADSDTRGRARLRTALLVLCVPIRDAGWGILRRITRGARPTIIGDREHLPMKLHDLGLCTGQTVLVLYIVSAILGVIGLSLHTPPEAPSIDKLYALVAMALVVLFVLAALTFAVTRRRRA